MGQVRGNECLLYNGIYEVTLKTRMSGHSEVELKVEWIKSPVGTIPNRCLIQCVPNSYGDCGLMSSEENIYRSQKEEIIA